MTLDSHVAKVIWSFFIGKGLNAFAVAGIMGNLYAESALKSGNLQNSSERKLNTTDLEYTVNVDTGAYTRFATDKCGYGLAQWTSADRKGGLLALAKARGKSIADISVQLEYLWNELNSVYRKKVLTPLKNAESIREASEIFVCKFEVPKSVLLGGESKENTIRKRTEYAEEFYRLYGGEGD